MGIGHSKPPHPLNPPQGDITTCHRDEFGKGNLPPLGG